MVEILILLIAGHALFDYALQGDFMAKAKNFAAPIPCVPWYQPMIAHCFIHGASVYLITGSVLFGLVEFVGHFLIDCAKCGGKITFNQDQGLHIAMKVAYVMPLFQ